LSWQANRDVERVASPVSRICGGDVTRDDLLKTFAKLLSPDTGAANNTHDTTGNLLTKTDVRGE
jgi:hypothetical protein